MLAIHRLTDYATLVMTLFAVHPEQVLRASDIVSQVPLSAATVRKVLKMLAGKGLLISSRGRGGGFRLARQPAAISLAEVMMAMDGRQSPTPCSDHPAGCTLAGVCGLRGHWLRIDQEIRGLLERTTLAQLVSPCDCREASHES